MSSIAWCAILPPRVSDHRKPRIEILQTRGPLVLSAIEVSVLMELVEANPQVCLAVYLCLIPLARSACSTSGSASSR